MKYYIISDVHSFYTLMRAALTEAGYFQDLEPHKLLLLGDLFDRGPEPLDLQKYVLELLAKDEVILIKGNYEDLFEELVTEDEGKPYDYHVHNGTYKALLELTGLSQSKESGGNLRLAAAGRDTPYYREIIPAMLDYYETDHYIFTHGWIPCFPEGDGWYRYDPDWRNAGDAEWKDARWYNGMVAARTFPEHKTVVCGHYNASFGHSWFEHIGSEFGEDADFSPYYARRIIAIDACTAFSGKVNCIVAKD